MSTKKAPLEVTVKGVAAYAWLYKKDMKFAKGDDDGKHKLSIVVKKEDLDDLIGGLEGGTVPIKGNEWKAHVLNMHEQAGGDDSNAPIKDGDNQLGKNGKPKSDPNKDFFGSWLINLKTGYKPQLVDTKKGNLPADVLIMSGDVVKAVYRPYVFDGGVSLRLNAVMLIEKNNDGFNSAGAFGDDEEGFVAEKSDTDAAFDGAADDNNGDY